MTLSEKQEYFSVMLGKLLAWVSTQPDLAVTGGEWWRSPETAQMYAQEGEGIVNSLHCQRLAVDLNVFVNGVYTTDAASYARLGEFWKSLDPLNRWGGDFQRADLDHFEYNNLS